MGVGLSCILKENIGSEVDDFITTAWDHGENLYMDQQLEFYKAVAGGQLKSSSAAGFLFKYMTGYGKVSSNIKRTESNGFSGNLKGEGFTKGGLFVVRQDGSIAYQFHEDEIGDHAPLADVLEACRSLE